MDQKFGLYKNNSGKNSNCINVNLRIVAGYTKKDEVSNI
jgi:hypothetical protein